MPANAAQMVEARDFTFSDAQFDFLAGLANRMTGIVLASNKKDMVYGRLVRRLRALKLEGFDSYCDLLQSPAGIEELGELVNAITTNLTRFFREPHHFTSLGEQLSGLVEQGHKRLRIWSAGCSSGMEPYSIAMAIAAMGLNKRCDIKILATDIDTTMLETASRGHYSADDVAPVPAECRKYLSAAETGYIVSEEIRQMITFNYLNLLESWPMRGTMDAIFCRNVVIYFDKPTKQKLFDRMAQHLTPEGRLYIGHSENLTGITNRFELTGRTIYRQAA